MILSAAILLLILMPVCLSMLLSLPIIQNKITSLATDFASEYLQTEVSIGRIDITMSGRVEVKEFLVRDMDHDTLLYVSHLNSRLLGYSHSDRRLTLGGSTIKGAVLNLRQTERGDMNIREITLKLSSKSGGGGKFSIFITDADLSDMQLRIEQLKHNNPEYGVDVKNIVANDLSGKVRELTIDGSAIHGFIDRLSAVEQSGFTLQDAKGELYLTQGALALTDLTLTTQWSSLKMPYLTLAGCAWADYKDFNKNIDLSFEVSDGYLSSDDVAYFSPSVMNYGVVLYDLDLAVSGEVSDMDLTLNNVSYGEGTFIAAKAKLDGLPDLKRVGYDVEIDGITTQSTDMNMLYASVSQREFTPQVAHIISEMGRATLRGEIKGEQGGREMDVVSQLESGLGGLTTDMSISLGDRGRVVLDGDVAADGLDLGRALVNKTLGKITFHSSISGSVGSYKSFKTASNIDDLQLFGQHIRGISVKSDMQGGDVRGEVVTRDPNLDFDLQLAAANLGASVVSKLPSYNVGLELQHANLTALGVNCRDTTSVLSASVVAVAEGRDLERASLDVEVIDGEYSYNSNTISAGEMSLRMNSDERDRSVALRSRFLDLDFNSTSRVATILGYLNGMLVEYLPSLYNNDGDTKSELIYEDDGSTSTFVATAKDITPITKAVMEDLEVAEGSSVRFDFSEREHLFDLKVNSDFIERKALLATGLNTHITNQDDSLTMVSRFNDLYIGTSRIRGAEVLAGAKSDNISLVSRFENPTDSISADIKALLELRKLEDGKRAVEAQLKPSTIIQRDRLWSLGARTIDLSDRGVLIDNFVAESRNQRLDLNGYASRSESDTLRMKMRDFDLSILSSIIARVGYEIDGRTNGEVVASSTLDNAKLRAHVQLDSVSVNTIAAPAMEMDVTWDSKLNRARLILENRASRDTLVRGYYIPSQVKYYARCEVDSLNMGLLDPPLGGVITDTKGYAHLDLTLQGQRREAVLSGGIKLEDFATTIAYTGVRYSVDRAMVEVSNNRLLCQGAKVKDEVGGGGDLDIDVDLQHLSNIGYSIKVLPQKMMVLNTTERDNELFYGEVYASGLAQISGDRSGVRMNITASSEDNSHFYMPLTDKANVSAADFITFVKPRVVDSLDVVASRRRTFERRNQSSAGSMVINMSLDVKPNTEVQLVIDPTVGDIIKARGEGQLNLSLEPKANRFEIYGDYTISEGSYLFTLQNIVNKRFLIDPGSSIQWTGSPMDARLNINAIYKLKASLQPLIAEESSRAVPVDCIIRLTDMLTQPDVDFSIELPSSDGETQAMFSNLLNDQEAISRQFFYLMLANSFIPEASGGSADLGASAGAATGFELLTNQLSNWLSSSNYNVIIRYRPESELTGDELDVGFSKGLVNNRLLVELEGNYVTDNAATATGENVSNFMGEAYITWLIDRAGALRLKGFTQTIDRFDENQGLQETGIGVYYRESFNNFADLRERVRARFKASDDRIERREERRRQRAERREAQQAIADEKRRNKDKNRYK